MTNYQELSENELEALINNAEKALKAKQEKKRREVITQIKELAASINLVVEIHEGKKGSSRKGTKVPVKYQNPDNPAEQWTGRGVTPKWLRAFLEAGRDKAEFEV